MAERMTAPRGWRGPSSVGGVYPDLPAGMLRHALDVRSDVPDPVTFKVRTRVYNAGIAPAAFKAALKRVEVGVVAKAPKKRR